MFPNRREPDKPLFMIWTGTPERATEISIWVRTGGLVPRRQWQPGDEIAPVLDERHNPHRAELVPIPPGTLIRRRQPGGDPPPKMEEADWPLEVQLPGTE
jgi:hypothetical protein